MAGYSGTPLAQKLGIKEGHHVVLLEAPKGFNALLEPLPAVSMATKLQRNADVIVLFVTRRIDLATRVPEVMKKLIGNGGLWIAWPKKASKVPTDITEDTIREVALPRGLVDNKVCAIDEVWSGLRLVYRKENREPPTTKRR